jgi:phospholipase C
MAGTAFGHIQNDADLNDQRFDQRTIFDVLDRYGISWKAYRSYLAEDYYRVFPAMRKRDDKKIVRIGEFERDLKHGRLPQVALLDSSELLRQDEHPSASIQLGQYWVARRVRALLKSDYWKSSVLFLAYDESGGFYDHVPPAAACAPDSIPPASGPGLTPGAYTYTGFRVPFIAVSPWVKRHHVSHATYDHTSLLRYIEEVFNLPALTRRDANADPFRDLFDYEHPDFTVPRLPHARIDRLERTPHSYGK